MTLTPPDAPLTDGVVLLRPLTLDDLPGVEEALGDPEITHRFGKSPLSPPEFIASKQAGWAEGAAAFAVIDLDGAFVGQVFAELGEAATAEVGYWLLPRGRGHGYAARAVKLLSMWAFASVGLARLQLWAEADNVASQRVAERTGFIREGVLRSFRQRDGERFDAILYSLLPSDLAEDGAEVRAPGLTPEPTAGM